MKKTAKTPTKKPRMFGIYEMKNTNGLVTYGVVICVGPVTPDEIRLLGATPVREILPRKRRVKR
jgi:hypothetical protein